MHNCFATFGDYSVRERRLVFFEQLNHAEPLTENEVNTQITQDVAYMEGQFKEILDAVQREQGVMLSAERGASVERQRQTIIQRLDAVRTMHFQHRNEYINTRNALVGQVESLLAYARFQAEHQRQAERNPAGPLPIEESEEGDTHRIWVEGDPRSLFQFSYVRKTPGVARLVGNIDIRPDVVRSRMDGCFQFARVEQNGKHYFVVSVDPDFDGTFTFFHEGKRATVDTASRGENRQMQAKLRAVPEPVPAADTLDIGTLETQLQAGIKEYQDLVSRAQILAVALAEAVAADRQDEVKGLQEQSFKLQADIKAAQDRFTDIARRMRDIREARQLSLIGEPRVRQVYQFLQTQPRDVWAAVDVAHGGVEGAEYRLMRDGVLYARRQDNPENPGEVTTYRRFVNNAWEDTPVPVDL